jgi:PAS domain S-box-containing protein
MERFQQEYRILRKDGTVRWVDDRTVVERNDEGRVTHLQGIVVDNTERKMAEEALKESEQRFRTLAEASFEGIALSEEGVLVDVNDQLATMLSRGRGDLIGRPVSDFISPEHRELAAEAQWAEQLELSEHLMFRSDGTPFPVETRTRITQIGGRQLQLTAIREITERKRAQQAIRESEDKYKRLVETTGTGFVILDEGGRVLDANQEYARLTGHQQPGELLGRNVLEWTAPNDHARNAAEVRRCITEGFIRNLEVDYVTPTGQLVPVEINATFLRLFGRVQIHSLCRDIKERKREKEALRESEERLRLTLDAANIVVWEGALDGGFHEIGPVDKLFGKPKGVFHTNLADLNESIHPEDRRRVAEEIERSLRGEKDYYSEYRIPQSDGSIHWIEAQGTLLRDEQGTPLRFLGIAREVTERKRALDVLQENMRRLQTVVTGAPIVLYSFDRNGVFTLSEGKGLTGLGLKPGEIVGRTVFEVYGDQPYAIAALRRALAGETFTVELSFAAGGTFEVSHTAIQDAAGSYAGTIGVLVDITERKRAEEAVRNSEANLQLAFEAARIGDWMWNIASGEVLWSARCKALYGLSADTEITYERFLERVHPDDRDRVDRALRQAVETRGDYEVEKRVIWPDGSMHWNASRGRVFCDDTGRPVRLVGVTLEITDRKQAEQALLKTEEKYSKAFNSSPDSISLSDIDTGELLEVNTGFERVFGHKREEIIGKSTRELDVYINPSDRDRMIEVLKRDGKVQNLELEGRRKSGERFEGLLSVETMELGGKRLMITTVRDITDRKQAEKALRESEERFRLFMDHFPGLAYMKDSTGRILFANEGFRTLVGLAPEEIIGRSNEGVFPPGFAEQITTDDLDVLATGENKQIEEHLQDRIWSTYKFVLPQVGGPPLLGGFTLDITERKRAEQALALLLQRHNLATQAAKIGVWDWDIPDDNLVWDDNMYTLYGITPDAFDGAYSAWISGVHPDDRALCDDAIQQVLRGEKEYDIEFRVLWPSGSEHIIKAFGQVIRDPAGTPIRLTGVNYDITARKRSEQALQESEAKFRAAFENAPIGMSMVQPDGRYLDVNPALCRMFGYSKEELLGGTINKVTHPDDIERGNQWIRKMISGDRSVPEFEKRYIHRDGHIVWGLVRAEWIKDESGKPIMSVVHILDITERKMAEVALRESETRYRLLFESNPHPMWVYDLETLAFLTVNDAAVATYGFSQSEFLTMSTRDIRPEEDIPDLPDDTTNRRVLGGIDQSGVRRHRKKDQTVIDVEIISHPLTFKDRPAELVLANDITKRRRAEEKIQRLNEELESRVKDRTLQFEEANKELEAFTYSVSHDLRAPLRAIDGFTRILLEDHYNSLDEEGRRVCNVVRTETQRMGQLVDDLLSLSRLSRSHKEPTTIHMAALVESALNETIPSECRSRLELFVEALPNAIGDSNLVRQVWSNLLSNAVKFSSKHPQPRIEICGRRVGNEIEYSVHDNGAGFDMKYAAKLFGVFQRLHSSKEFEGTGVGLAIVQRIVHRHGGRVWAEGETDQGATFYFTLPAERA